jgi:P2 family phage contractile tail tube protein
MYQTKTIKSKLYNRKDGKNAWLSDSTTVTFPDFEMLSETFKGAGINGEFDLPTLGQFGAMEVEVSHNGLSKDTIATFGMETQHLECRWAAQLLNSKTGDSEVVGKKIIFKGLPKKLGIGSIEPNKAEESSSTFSLLYFKYIIGNDVVLEYDKLNDVFKVNGIDYSAKIRAVL